MAFVRGERSVNYLYLPKSLRKSSCCCCLNCFVCNFCIELESLGKGGLTIHWKPFILDAVASFVRELTGCLFAPRWDCTAHMLLHRLTAVQVPREALRIRWSIRSWANTRERAASPWKSCKKLYITVGKFSSIWREQRHGKCKPQRCANRTNPCVGWVPPGNGRARGGGGGGRLRIRPWGGSGWRKGFGKKNGHWLETWGKLHSTMG